MGWGMTSHEIFTKIYENPVTYIVLLILLGMYILILPSIIRGAP
jgi:hypothetical protein